MKVPNANQMKQFLYGELSEQDSQAIEEQFFANSELLYELANLENELVDQYVHGKLAGEELARFEQSLTKSDDRRTQVKNARALKNQIREEKEAASARAPEIPRPSLWKRWPDFFAFRLPVPQFAMLGLILLLGGAGFWLLFDRYQLRRELAQTRSQQAQREHDLESKVAEARQELEGLERRAADERRQKELRLQQLEKELEDQRRQRSASEYDIAGRYTAEIRTVGNMGRANPRIIKRTERSVTFELPLQVETDYQTYEVRDANNQVITVGKNVVSRSGKKYMVITLPAKTLAFSVVGINEGMSPERVSSYRLEIRRR